MGNLRSIIGSAILALAFFAVAPLPSATACINDSRSGQFERKMQDDYRPSESMPSESLASGLVLAGMGVGGTLLLGSLAWSVWRNMIAV